MPMQLELVLTRNQEKIPTEVRARVINETGVSYTITYFVPQALLEQAVAIIVEKFLSSCEEKK